MKKLLFIQVLLFISLIVTNSAFAENKSISITVESVGLSKRQAIKEGLKQAVEEARGIVISSNTVVVNGKVVADKSSTYSDGYISEYKIVNEEIVDKKVHLTIAATVVMENAFDDNKSNTPTATNNNSVNIKQENVASIQKDNKTNVIDNGTINNNDNLSDNNSVKQSIIDSKNNNKDNFKSVVNMQIPQIMKSYEEIYEFNLNYKLVKGLPNQNKFKTVPMEVDYIVSINMDKYNRVTNSLVSFLNSLGLNKQEGSYEISVNSNGSIFTYKMGQEEFKILEEVLEIDFRFFSLVFMDKNKKELDNFNIDSFISVISNKNNSISIRPLLLSSSKEKYVKTIFADPNILNNTFSLLGKVSNKRDLGYLIGIRGEYVDKGFIVNEIDDKSPAMNAGFLMKDVIVNINNVQVFSNTKIYNIINNMKDGYHKFEVIREGQNYVLDVYPVRRLNNYKPYM